MSKTVDPRAGKSGRRPKSKPLPSNAKTLEPLVAEIFALIDSGALLDEQLSLARNRDLYSLLSKKNRLTPRECDLLHQLLLRICGGKVINVPTYWFKWTMRELERIVRKMFYNDRWYNLDIGFPARCVDDFHGVEGVAAGEVAFLQWIIGLCNEILKLRIPRDSWSGKRREAVFEILELIQELVDLPEAVADAEKRVAVGRSDAYAAQGFLDRYNKTRHD